MCVCLFIFKELAHAMVEVQQVQHLQPAGWRPAEKLMVHVQSKSSLLAEFPLLWGRSVLLYEVRQPSRRGPPTLWGVICFPPSLLISCFCSSLFFPVIYSLFIFFFFLN